MTLHRKTAADARPSVGRDCDAWCSRCNMALEHTIIAMVGLEIVRVKCNTCNSEHKYKSAREAALGAERTPTTKAKSKAATAASAPRPRSAVSAPPPSNASRLLWTRSMGDRDRAKALAYTPALVASPGSLIDHKQFGYGIVDAVIDGKSRVLFEDGYKVLVTGR